MKNPISFTKAPGNVTSDNSNIIKTSTHETALLLSQTYEEISEATMKTSLQAEPVPQPEKKRFRIKEEEPDRKSIKKKDGNDTAPFPVTRSVSSNMHAEDNWQRLASLFFCCINYAIYFFIYFLSVACSAVPHLRLPTLTFSKPFKKI